MTVLAIVFWLCAALLVYTQLGYGLLIFALTRLLRARVQSWSAATDELPSVSVIVAAYQEESVIAARVANLRALDYPRYLVEVVVCCDGSPDATAERARAAGADLVLELSREGKVRAQD